MKVTSLLEWSYVLWKTIRYAYIIKKQDILDCKERRKL